MVKPSLFWRHEVINQLSQDWSQGCVWIWGVKSMYQCLLNEIVINIEVYYLYHQTELLCVNLPPLRSLDSTGIRVSFLAVARLSVQPLGKDQQRATSSPSGLHNSAATIKLTYFRFSQPLQIQRLFKTWFYTTSPNSLFL